MAKARKQKNGREGWDGEQAGGVIGVMDREGLKLRSPWKQGPKPRVKLRRERKRPKNRATFDPDHAKQGTIWKIIMVIIDFTD